jgi:CheY-like chemotaxis protein
VPVVILLVDDDDGYALLMPLAFKKAQLEVSLQCVGDGAQAIEYLRGDGKYADRRLFPFPSLVLLDLKMPRINGFEVLEWKRVEPGIKSLPVVVWSSSELPEDIEKATYLGACSYIVKSEDLVGIAKSLELFWNGSLSIRIHKEWPHWRLRCIR